MFRKFFPRPAGTGSLSRAQADARLDALQKIVAAQREAGIFEVAAFAAEIDEMVERAAPVDSAYIRGRAERILRYGLPGRLG